MSDYEAVVIDNGTGYIKAGFASGWENGPLCVVPSVVGTTFVPNPITGENTRFVGQEAIRNSGICTMNYPMSGGLVTNWTDMEDLWRHTFFTELRCEPENFNVMLTDAPQNPVRDRERMLEIMMSTFKVKGFYVMMQAILSIHGAGRATGCVIDSGDGVTHAIPIFAGFEMKFATQKAHFAGRNLTEYIIQETNLIANCLHFPTDIATGEKIKQDICYVAENYDAELEAATTNPESVETDYTLPGGRVVKFGVGRFRCPEALYHPEWKGKPAQYAPHMLLNSCLQATAPQLHDEFYGNILLSGGTTMLKGYETRLANEIVALNRKSHINVEARIIANPERYTAVWKGAATMSSLESHQRRWITKNMFEDQGAFRCIKDL